MDKGIKDNGNYVKDNDPKHIAEHFGLGQIINWPLLILGIGFASISGGYGVPITIQIGVICGTMGGEVNQAWGNGKDGFNHRVLDSSNDVATANIFTSLVVLIYIVTKCIPFLINPGVYIALLVIAGFIAAFIFIGLVQLTIIEIKKVKKKKQAGVV